jgi:ankyrin repeat protein
MATNPELRALELAIAHGDTEETDRLLDDHAHLLNDRFPENIGLTPLMWACRNRHLSIVESLLRRGAAVEERNFRDPSGDGGNTALWFTAQGAFPGALPIARLLLQHQADVNAWCEHGTTPIHMAVAWLHLELVQFLVSRGADAFTRNDAGLTPLEAIRKSQAWCQAQETKTDDMKRLIQRAPRMIAYLEKIHPAAK